jgi:hypothetical protein
MNGRLLAWIVGGLFGGLVGDTLYQRRKRLANVFVSFDWDNDRRYRHLLAAWHANPRFNFVFNDYTPAEINSANVGVVKAALTRKIRAATHTLVIVGQYANTRHALSHLIGFKNWINFEIHQSVQVGNRIAAIKLSRNFQSPDELLGVNASWAMSFNELAVIEALNEA